MLLATLLLIGYPAKLPAISQPNLAGQLVQVLPSQGKEGVVVFFVISGCPNAQAYAPEMNRIAARYGPMGWNFYLDYADTSNTADLEKDAKQFGYAFTALRGQGELLHAAKATMSPEAAVFSSSGSLLYHGRIDDRFYALGKSRLAPRTRDLRDALDSIYAGKQPSHSSTLVVGCYLPKG